MQMATEDSYEFDWILLQVAMATEDLYEFDWILVQLIFLLQIAMATEDLYEFDWISDDKKIDYEEYMNWHKNVNGRSRFTIKVN